MNQIEIIEPASIIDTKGAPVNLGWARKPVFSYNPAFTWTPQRFTSSSDRYVIFSKSFMFVYEIYDGGYLGFIHVTAVSLIDKHIASRVILIPFPLGDLSLPNTSVANSIRLRHEKTILDFIALEQGSRIVKVDIQQVGHNRNLRGEVVLIEPVKAQSIYTNSMYLGENKRFQFLRCSPWWSVEGVMQYENMEMAFNRGKAWGIFYWSRITRPLKDVHYWAAGCGLWDGQELSFNIGYGTVDNSYGTENAFFVNGKMHKLELVTFQASPSGWLKPWKFTSNNFRLEMTFYPVQQYSRKNHVFYQLYQVRQVYGFFSGRVTLDDNTIAQFDRISGIIERRETKS
ncbi:MAG: DUF2804 domain-containing protein [Spirochaetaceae bacterium]|jgi:hypothetical protein|nr:DUF2804 domain-containing protein [Spirochaetaceae bacterium]